MQQRKSGVSDSADKLPVASPRHRRLDGRGSKLRRIRRHAAPKHSEPTGCRQHRRRCFRRPNLALVALAHGEACLADGENAFRGDAGPQSRVDQTEGMPRGSSPREACATGARRHRLDFLVRASPSLPHVATDAGVPPVATYPAARFVQSDLASTYGARQASLDSVFLAGFIPRLQFEVRRGGCRAAERERDSVVKFEIG